MQFRAGIAKFEVGNDSCDMVADTFLGRVAEACLSHYGDLSEFCFVFPNRRSGTFFLKRLSEACGAATLLAPDVMPVADFMARLSGFETAPRITQIMQLYLAYRELRKMHADINDSDAVVDFDEFLHWGEVVLNDFNETDMYDADAAELFKNVTDYRSIATDFLTPEQKDAIVRYFGYSPDRGDVERFWKSFNDNGDTVIKDKFRQLWQMLHELYVELRRRLEHPEPEGFPMCMAGSGYRMAMEKVENILDSHGPRGAALLPWKHIVVVGLDTLSTTEAKTFTALRKMRGDDDMPVIDFFWDLTGPVLKNKDFAAGNLIRHNREENFPEPEWSREFMSRASRRDMPVITEVGVPSNAMQAKVAGKWVEELIARGYDADNIEDARVAVVLPDEDLLLPLLYSLPLDKEDGDESAVRNVNLTMGWPMRFTSTAAFMYHLQRILVRATGKENPVYLCSDIHLLLAQPVVEVLMGMRNVADINTAIGRRRRRTVTWEDLNGFSSVLGGMLRAPSPEATPAQSGEWLQDLLLRIDEKLADSGDAPQGIKTKVERMQIQTYVTALNQLMGAAAEAGVDMCFNTLFHMLQKIVSAGKINFEGEPLQGLQVMGFLETRALDFDRIIILSMNDKVMPRRARRRSFIPNMLRRGYGLPLVNADEERYAYWFYRLLSRAGDVTLVYDSRVGEGMRSGGKSRYLMQLEKLHARESIGMRRRIFRLGSSEPAVKAAPKTPSVLRRLEKYFSSGKDAKALSATSLQSYIKCPLEFYYRFVLGYKDDPVDQGFIDAITQGNIFHRMMRDLYFTPGERGRYLPEGKVLDRSFFETWLHPDSDEKLRRMMRRIINEEFNRLKEEDLDRPLRQSVAMVADRLLSQVKAVLRYDLSRAPVRLYGGEFKESTRLHVGDRHPWMEGREFAVNLTATFDRVDESEGHLRIVDFKTGSVKLKIDLNRYVAGGGRLMGEEPSILDPVFGGDYECKNVFQLLLYAGMLDRMRSHNGDLRRTPVEMVIFDTNELEKSGEVKHPKTGEGKNDIVRNQLHPGLEDFDERLRAKIAEIFDPSRDFEPTPDVRDCSYCVMSRICGSEAAD